MYRNTPLLFALTVFVTCPAAIAASEKTQALHPHVHMAKLTRVADTTERQSRKKSSDDVLAMSPRGAEAEGWGVKLASATPAEIAPPIRSEPEEPDLNVLGMLAAALGLGAMSIVRRMGRF